MKSFMKENDLGLGLTEEELEYVPFCSGNVLQSQGKQMDAMIARHFIGSAPLLAQSVENYVPDNATIAQELFKYLVMAVEKKGNCQAPTVNEELIDELNDSDTGLLQHANGAMNLRPKKRKLEETADETDPEPIIPEFDSSKLETYSVVRLFFALNDLLPVSQRYSSFPQYQPSLFPLSLTEDCLLGIIGAKDSRLWFGDFLNPSKL